MLVALTTHPIQYQAPIWRALAERGRVPFRVLYMSDQGARLSNDPGFGVSFAWDVDLLSGYSSDLIAADRGSTQHPFWRMRLQPGFVPMLQRMGARVLWVQGWQVAAYWQAVFAARNIGIDVWLRGESNGRSGASGLRGAVYRVLLDRFFSRVDRFLSIGAANRSFYLERRIRPERIVSAPYGVDNRQFRERAREARTRRGAIREALGIPADAFCILFAGKFVPKKRPLDLVAAVARLRSARGGGNPHLLFVGSGALGPALRAASDVRFDAEQAVAAGRSTPDGQLPAASFAGFMNQGRMADAYAAADCLVLPSDSRETWGLVVNEAMASGLPCVVSDACGCADDLVKPIWPELCYPCGDVDALAAAIGALMANSLPPASLQATIERYDCLRTVEAVEGLYEAETSRHVATGISLVPA